MASDLPCDNRKMESASNAFPFMSLCANRYWKSERGCWLPSPVYSCHCADEWLQNQNLAENIMHHRAVHLCLIIFDWVSSCLFHSLVAQLSAHKKPAVRIVSEHSGTSVQFPQMASFPKLPSSRPLASSGDAESIIRCVWAAPISATPVGGADIEWPFLHGSLILTQSLRLITMGTFHRVLDLINGFFPWLPFLPCLLSPPFSPALLPSFSLLLRR